MSSIDHLLQVVAGFADATGLSEGTVSARFLGGGAVVRQLREGRDMGARRIARALDEFSAAWPDGKPWPAGVPRDVAAEPVLTTRRASEDE